MHYIFCKSPFQDSHWRRQPLKTELINYKAKTSSKFIFNFLKLLIPPNFYPHIDWNILLIIIQTHPLNLLLTPIKAIMTSFLRPLTTKFSIIHNPNFIPTRIPFNYIYIIPTTSLNYKHFSLHNPTQWKICPYFILTPKTLQNLKINIATSLLILTIFPQTYFKMIHIISPHFILLHHHIC